MDEQRTWDSEDRSSPYSTVSDPGCECPEDAAHPSDCLDCPVHGDEVAAEMEAEQRGEIEAENAWLRAAEAGTAEDYAFERYEQEMGLGLGEIDGGGA